MARFVSFKAAPGPDGKVDGPAYVVVNPEYVVMFEPRATADQPKCRLWLAIPGGLQREDVNFCDVVGTVKDVGLRLQEPPSTQGDPLGTHHRD